jgi:hypothetical protein
MISKPFLSDPTTAQRSYTTVVIEAVAMQESSETVDRGIALTYKLNFSLILPMPLHEFETVKQGALTFLSETTDAYFQNGVRFTIGYVELTIGRINEARNSARELMQVGQLLNDPRSTGWLLVVVSYRCGVRLQRRRLGIQ